MYIFLGTYTYYKLTGIVSKPLSSYVQQQKGSFSYDCLTSFETFDIHKKILCVCVKKK